MKYTQQELEGMDDFELNLLVCSFVPVIVEDAQGDNDSSVMVSDIVNMYPLDYCNNWNDCGALIDEIKNGTGSTVEFDEDVLIIYKRGGAITVKYTNLKRAVTIAYILIKQDE